jgi:CheY-like chemotaxis protein
MDILVIDDEPRLLMVMRLVLEVHHRVVAEASAREALQRIAAGERFDIILCDLMMPGMSGADFHLEVTKKAPEQADDIVFMSGGIISARVQEYLEQIPNLCLDKPFSERTLLELIDSHVA